MPKLVAESLEELNEGKFGRGLATAGLATAMALSPMAKSHAQSSVPSDDGKAKTEIH